MRQPHQTPTGSAGGPGSESPSTFIASCLPPSLPSFVNSTLDLKSKSSVHDVLSPSIYARLVSILFWYVQNYVFPVGKKILLSLMQVFSTYTNLCTQIQLVHVFVSSMYTNRIALYTSVCFTFSLSIKVLFMLLIIYEALANRCLLPREYPLQMLLHSPSE